MVAVTLTPYRGNHQRFFPHAGFLGLTPVLLQGTFATALEEDLKPVQATHAVVRIRCYEADIAVSATKGKSPNVLYESSQTVWTKEASETYTPLGDFRRDWRIVVPKDCVAPGTASFRHYRIWWQVEAVVYHKPSSIFGTRRLVAHQVPLRRFAPPVNQPGLPVPSWFMPSSAAHRRVGYSASLKGSLFGPADDLGVEITFDLGDPSVTLKKVVVTLERRMMVRPRVLSASSSSLASASASEDVTMLLSEQDRSRPSSYRQRSPWRELSPMQARRSGHDRTDSATSSSSAFGRLFASSSTTSVSTHVVMTAEQDMLTPYTNNVEASVPKTKSLFRYATGETLSSGMANIAFYVSMKIAIKTRQHGTEWIELEPQPVNLTGVSAEERQKAAAAAKKLLALAEAENRIFDGKSSKRSSQNETERVSVGARRASHFAMRIDIPKNDATMAALPSPTRSVGSASSGRDFLAEPLPDGYPSQSAHAVSARRRRDEELEGHSRSRTRSATGELEGDPQSPDGAASGTAPSGRVSSTSTRRGARATTPYSTLRRPRSIGQLSAASGARSEDTVSVSSRSIASSNASLRSGARSARHERGVKSTSGLAHQTLHEAVDAPPISPPSTGTTTEEGTGKQEAHNTSPRVRMDPLPTPISPPMGYPRAASSPATRSDNDRAVEMSPALIDFSSFSLRAPERVTSVIAATQGIDMAVVAPWTVEEDVCPLETPPPSARHQPSSTNGWPGSHKAGVFSSPPQPPSPRLSTTNMTTMTAGKSSNAQLRKASVDPMDVEKTSPPPSAGLALSGSVAPPPQAKRKGSSVGFGLFGKSSSATTTTIDDGNGSPSEGSRWGFIRRTSKTAIPAPV